MLKPRRISKFSGLLEESNHETSLSFFGGRIGPSIGPTWNGPGSHQWSPGWRHASICGTFDLYRWHKLLALFGFPDQSNRGPDGGTLHGGRNAGVGIVRHASGAGYTFSHRFPQ